MRKNYGDVAIGWVQVKRINCFCTVETSICPEHKVRSKDYTVRVVVNEKKDDEHVVTAQYLSCTASEGGCKHAVPFLACLNRKSEDPPPTATECYWKKPLLSSVGVTIMYAEISHIVKKKKEDDGSATIVNVDYNFLNSVLSHPKTV